MTDRWYWDGGLWHAHKEDASFWCGLTLVTLDEGKLVQGPDDDPYPPQPCPKCLHETAMRDCVDEPLEAAKARGYYKGAPLDF